MTVTADLPGYLPSTDDVVVGGSDVTHDVALQVDDNTCAAPGYVFNTSGITEDFDGGALPDGWTVTDEADNGQVWTFDDPGGQGNLTGGEGGFAIVDSDDYGPGGVQDTSLVSPVDRHVRPDGAGRRVRAGLQQPGRHRRRGRQHRRRRDLGDRAAPDDRRPRSAHRRAPAADGRRPVRGAGPVPLLRRDVRWWWQVDDVFVGNRTCDPSRAVSWSATSATRTGDGHQRGDGDQHRQAADKATTKPTPDDPTSTTASTSCSRR